MNLQTRRKTRQCVVKHQTRLKQRNPDSQRSSSEPHPKNKKRQLPQRKSRAKSKEPAQKSQTRARRRKHADDESEEEHQKTSDADEGNNLSDLKFGQNLQNAGQPFNMGQFFPSQNQLQQQQDGPQQAESGGVQMMANMCYPNYYGSIPYFYPYQMSPMNQQMAVSPTAQSPQTSKKQSKAQKSIIEMQNQIQNLTRQITAQQCEKHMKQVGRGAKRQAIVFEIGDQMREIVNGTGIFKTQMENSLMMGNVFDAYLHLVSLNFLQQDEGLLVLVYSRKDRAYLHVGKVSEIASSKAQFRAPVSEKDLLGYITQMIHVKFKRQFDMMQSMNYQQMMPLMNQPYAGKSVTLPGDSQDSKDSQVKGDVTVESVSEPLNTDQSQTTEQRQSRLNPEISGFAAVNQQRPSIQSKQSSRKSSQVKQLAKPVSRSMQAIQELRSMQQRLLFADIFTESPTEVNFKSLKKYADKTIIGTLFELYNSGSSLESSHVTAKMLRAGAEVGFDYEKQKHRKVQVLLDFIEKKQQPDRTTQHEPKSRRTTKKSEKEDLTEQKQTAKINQRQQDAKSSPQKKAETKQNSKKRTHQQFQDQDTRTNTKNQDISVEGFMELLQDGAAACQANTLAESLGQKPEDNANPLIDIQEIPELPQMPSDTPNQMPQLPSEIPQIPEIPDLAGIENVIGRMDSAVHELNRKTQQESVAESKNLDNMFQNNWNEANTLEPVSAFDFANHDTNLNCVGEFVQLNH